MPNPNMPESQCQICMATFRKPVGSKVEHRDATGARCVGSIVPTGPAF
jgi:hypothetical protein